MKISGIGLWTLAIALGAHWALSQIKVGSVAIDESGERLLIEIEEPADGRFQVESATSLGSGEWTLIESVASSPIEAPLVGDQTFIRVSVAPEPEPAIAFGCLGEGAGCDGPTPLVGCGRFPVSDWKSFLGPDATSDAPLSMDWWVGPYQNKAGYDAVEKINAWFRDGRAAGLTQDAFRSYDNDHSKLRNFYPQLVFKSAESQLLDVCRKALRDRVTFGTQSLQFDSARWGQDLALPDVYQRLALLEAYDAEAFGSLSGPSGYVSRESWRAAYEGNFLLVFPSLKSLESSGEARSDRFTFLTPYALGSVGASGTDAALLKPLVFAAAALPIPLKDRLYQAGLMNPTLQYLWKSSITGDILDPEAHQPAYVLPAEATEPPPEPLTLPDGSTESRSAAYERVDPMPAPVLDRLLALAHSMDRLPPVARLSFPSAPMIVDTAGAPVQRGYLAADAYGVEAALRPSEIFRATVDLRHSFWDEGGRFVGSLGVILRTPSGDAPSVSLEERVDEPGVWDIEVHWQDADGAPMRRTDGMFLIDDGFGYSAPAYLSIRHLQEDEWADFGV